MQLINYIVLFLSFTDLGKSHAQNLKVHYLVPGEVIDFVPNEKRRGFYESDVRIYCYKGSQKIITNYFQTIILQIDIENIDDFTQYEGDTPEIVKEHHEEQKSLFSFNFFAYKKTKMRLNPFNQTCMGIETLQPYSIRLNLIRIDIWKLTIFIVALIVFSYAAKLSQNEFFYYIAGVSLGICASFIILLYLAGKLFPRRSMMIGVFAGGSTLVFYIFRLLWDNIQMILVSYKNYAIGYIITTGFISFIICYRFGPPKNKRSRDLIEWSLQIICLAGIFFSTYHREASLLIIIFMLIFYYFPRGWIRRVKNFYRRLFPPCHKYITLEEYKQQGIVETKKALEELRKYCNSPECKQWSVMTRLKNPKRFASFIEGEPHLMDEEIFDHDSANFDDAETDDEIDINNTNNYINRKYKISDNEIQDDYLEEEEEISEDEELYIPTQLKYRGASTSRTSAAGIDSRNQSYRIHSNYANENISNSNNIRNQGRDSPYSTRVFSVSSNKKESPYSGRISSPVNMSESMYSTRVVSPKSTTRESPYNTRIGRKMTPNNSIFSPNTTHSRMTPNNSRIYYKSFREYSDEES